MLRVDAGPADAKRRQEAAPKADTSMSTSGLLGIACRDNMVRITNVLVRRRDDAKGTAALRAAATTNTDDTQYARMVALRVLAERGDPSALSSCEVRLATVPISQERMVLGRYIRSFDEWNRYSVEKLLLPRRDAKSFSLLRAAALGGTPLQRGVALSVLGRQDARGLLEHCETRLASAPDEQERTDLQSYLFALQPSVTLPLAHRLLARGGLARTVACRLLAKNRAALTRDALAELRTLFEEAVTDEAAFPDDDFCHEAIPSTLGLISDERSTHVLVAAYESTPCSFFRSTLLVALHRCNAPIAAALSANALYDSDRNTRRWATRHAPNTPLATARLRDLAARPFQRGDIDKLTKERLAEFDASTHE